MLFGDACGRQADRQLLVIMKKMEIMEFFLVINGSKAHNIFWF